MKSNVRIILWAFLSIIVSSYTCSTIKDTPAKKRQVENTARTLGQYSFLIQLEKTRKDIGNIYDKMLQLQDSLDRALYNVSSILDMKVASIDQEWLDLQDFTDDPAFYVEGINENPYGLFLKDLYSGNQTSFEIGQLLYFSKLNQQLPDEYDQFKSLISGRKQAKNLMNEFFRKRGIQASLIYQQWAGIYQEKALELNQVLSHDDRFAMSDFERIRLNRLAKEYMVMSYELTEKSDDLLIK